MNRILLRHVAGLLSRFCVNTLKIKTHPSSGTILFARFLHLHEPRLRHWSGECRQLARILPDAHATQLSAGLLLIKLNVVTVAFRMHSYRQQRGLATKLITANNLILEG